MMDKEQTPVETGIPASPARPDAPHLAAGNEANSSAAAREALPSPIFGTDISLPASALVEHVRDQLTRARGQLSDIGQFLGFGEHLKDVEGLLTCGIVALAYTREMMEQAEARRVEEPHCQLCGWPLARSADKGCVADNCSHRPEKGSREWWSMQHRRAVIAARRAKAASDAPAASASGAGRADADTAPNSSAGTER